MNKVLAITVKDLKNYFRSKETLFYTIAFPLLFMLIFGFIYSGSEGFSYRMNVCIVNLDHPEGKVDVTGQVAEALIGGMRNSTVFDVYVINTTTLPKKTEPPFLNMSKGELDGIVIIPEDFTESVTMGKQTKVDVIINEEDPNKERINQGLIRGYFKGFNRALQEISIEIALQYLQPENATLIRQYLEAFAEPVITNITGTVPSTERVSRLKFFIPGIIGFIILFTGTTFSAIPIALERDKGTLQRLLTTPTSSWTVLAGKALAVMSAVIIGIIVVTGIGLAIFNVKGLYWPLHLLIPCILLSSLNSIGTGLIFSSITRDANAANGISIAFTVSMQFFIGLYFPLELMPEPIQAVAKVFPLTYGVEAIRRLMLYNAPFQEIAHFFLILAVGATTVFIIGVLVYNWASKRLV